MSEHQGDPLLPSFIFSTAPQTSTQGFDSWAAEVSPLFEVAPPAEDGREFFGEIDGFLLDGIVIGNVRFGDQRYRRDRRLVAETLLDSYLVQYYADGGFDGTADDKDISVRPQDVCVFDLTSTLSTSARRSSGVTLIIPKSLVDRHWKADAPVNGLTMSGQSAIGRLLGAHMATLGQSASQIRMNEAGTIALGVAQLVASSLAFATSRREYDPKPLQVALLQRAQAFIRANLSSPSLSPQTVCTALKVSRPHLYRAFQDFGGVQRYIQEQRLLQAYSELRNPVNRGQTVGAIAYRCGFSSDAHFSRLFREMFDISPRQVRDGATAPPTAGPGLPSWLVRAAAPTNLAF